MIDLGRALTSACGAGGAVPANDRSIVVILRHEQHVFAVLDLAGAAERVFNAPAAPAAHAAHAA
ncbi:MAG TPA: hypothetical protein PLM58_13590 [Novosphingobium sp.]|nr:hypothetical protein [Novosphingobium sp.]